MIYTQWLKGMDRIYVIILFLKNNPETIEIKYHEDSCSIKIARGVSNSP